MKKRKYTFIHPTKSGGTCLERYFNIHYSDYIQCHRGRKCHTNKCADDNNPIIVVRDVKSRFISMYNYWKNGSDVYKRDELWKEEHKNVSIENFVDMLINKDTKKLHHGFTWNLHYQPTTKWLNNTNYKNIIIIKYTKQLNDKIQKLLDVLEIPNKNIKLPTINESVKVPGGQDIIYTDYVSNFVQGYYKEDVELIHTIETAPEAFKLVL